MKPTAEQEAICNVAKSWREPTAHPTQSLMVNALAGTGKTTTLVLLSQALPKRSTLALAFNVKIKKELEKRLPDFWTVLTMNGLGHRAWASAINKNQMNLNDRKIGELVTKALEPFPESKNKWDEIRQLVTAAMNVGLVPSLYEHFKGLVPDTPESWEELASDKFLELSPDERKLARVVLTNSIKESFKGHITFDDQIYMPTFFGGNFRRYEIVIVDEAQDLSPIQHLMLKKCCAGRLIVVGDPKQAIYAFRGADSSSIASIKKLRTNWIELPLNTTFRCPRAIVARQHGHAPEYRAAIDNVAGIVRDYGKDKWTWSGLEKRGDVAIICRNNGPIISMAFKLLRMGVSVTVLGRDIGKGLVSIAKKLAPDTSMSIKDFLPKLHQWATSEIEILRLNKKDAKADGIEDRRDCIIAVVEGAKPDTVADLIRAIENLFSETTGRVTLSSGHKSKGLEWDTVIHLDPWRIPSSQAKKALAEGDPRPIEQENNLRYVIETRSKHTLILADLSTFTEE